MTKMSDVANLAHVSTATVSRVLRNPSAVKKETRQRVLQAIEELNYQPNVLARQFRTNKTETILVVIPSLSNTVFGQILRGIEAVANQNNYRVLLATTNHNVDQSISYLDHLFQKQVDGMILMSSEIGKELLIEIDQVYPLVLVSEYLEGTSLSMVSIDNISSGRLATEHLIHLGHRRIAHVAGPLNTLLSRDRLKGYKQALLEHELTVDNILIQEGNFTYESGYELMLKLMALEKPPTAIFAANDEMAMGVIKAAQHRHLNVPEDVAVVGFDNIKFSALFVPGITTIAQPMYEMGEKAMELLLEQMKNQVGEKKQIVLESELIVRESCGARSGQAKNLSLPDKL